MPAWLDTRDTGFEAAFAALLAARRETADGVDDTVAAILADVKANGDVAVIAHTKRLDGFDVTPATMRVPADVVKRAAGACLPETVEALEFSLGLRWKPIAAVGLYVPGGTAAYPSSVLMNAVPAKIAGVQRVVMVVAAPGGQINPLVLAAADMVGVDEIYRIGGAQAVGALAFGTPTIARVDKIVGPGNVYVAAAKQQVFGIVGVDMIAGPSEIVVVADRFNDPAWIAADLLAQAEHDIAAQAILVADDKDFAEAVTKAIQVHLSTLPRAGIAAQSWETFGAVIVMESLADAGPLIDRIAPEHLELAVEEPETLAATVCNAGAIFLGRFAPEAVGDYVAGPNHVLPTAGSARFSSGLGVLDFLKRTSLIGCDRKSLAAVGPAAVALAKAEGLDAHALSLAIRLNRPQDA
jgi:histidinol dehydrogenase